MVTFPPATQCIALPPPIAALMSLAAFIFPPFIVIFPHGTIYSMSDPLSSTIPSEPIGESEALSSLTVATILPIVLSSVD